MGFYCKCGNRIDEKEYYVIKTEEVCERCHHIAERERIKIMKERMQKVREGRFSLWGSKV
jgi:recombinational DNA repair protein (RecF pathway)